VLTADFPMIELERPEERAGPSDSKGAGNYVITLVKGGDVLDEAPLLWRDTLPERFVRDHEQPLATPAMEIFCLTDVLIHGPGWASNENTVLFDPCIYPGYCRDRYRSQGIEYPFDADLSQLTEHRYQAGWHVSHFQTYIYGHWLLEMMPKLLAIQEFLRRWPEYTSMPVFMPCIFPEFVYAHTASLLPNVPIVTYDPRSEYIRGERIFMPTWGKDHVYNHWIAEKSDNMPSALVSGMPKQIFVSRRLKSSFRALDNLKEMEDIAIGEGLTVVYPVDLTFSGQIALFQNATIVAGEYSSALHNAIFSPAGTLVIALNWINACQSRIARLKRHRIGYVMPASGGEVLYLGDGSIQHYAIDPANFRAKLREAMGAQSHCALRS